MVREHYMVKLIPLFVAGFIAAVAFVGGITSIAAAISTSSLARFAPPMMEIIEVIAGLTGGTVAALSFGRESVTTRRRRSSHK